MSQAKLKGIGFGMIATLIWGLFYPVSRLLFGYEEDALDPLNFTALRFMLAALCLSPVWLKKENRSRGAELVRNEWKLLLFVGIFGTICEGVLVFWSLKYTTAARSSLMANTSPILTFLISWLAGRELFTRGKFSGMLIGFIGILVLFFSKGEDMFAKDATMIVGDLLALLSGLCWSIFTVFGNKISQKYGGMLCTSVFFILAVLLIVPIACVYNGGLDFNLSWRAWLGALYLGGCSYGFAEAMWYMALNYVTPAELGSLGYVSATIATVSSIVFLHEKPSFNLIIAIVLVVLGVWLMLNGSGASNDTSTNKKGVPNG